MTVNTHTTLEFSDIQSIQFECAKCHAVFSCPIERFNKPPFRCIACDSEQWLIPNSADFNDLAELGRLLKRMAARNNDLFVIRLGVKNSF